MYFIEKSIVHQINWGFRKSSTDFFDGICITYIAGDLSDDTTDHGGECTVDSCTPVLLNSTGKVKIKKRKKKKWKKWKNGKNGKMEKTCFFFFLV